MQLLSFTDYTDNIETDIIVKAEEDTIYYQDASSYLDFNSGLWNVNYGYSRPDLMKVIVNQYNRIAYYPNHYNSETDISKKYASELCKLFNYECVYFSNSGSEAVEISLYDIKGKIYTPTKSYHGSTYRTKKLSWYGQNYTDKLDESVDAVLIEPIAGNTGVYKIPQEIIEEINYYKDIYNYIIVCDEVTTGMGRSGYDSISKKLGINADRLIISKGLANGIMPISATLFNKKPYGEFFYGFTQSGNSLACAIGLKCLELKNQIDFKQKSKDINDILIESKLPFRQFGFMIGIDVYNSNYVRNRLKNEQFLVRDCGEDENTLIISPMFITSINHIKQLIEMIERFNNG